MTQFSRVTPAQPADMVEVDRELVAPYLADFHKRLAEIMPRIPFGVPMDVDLEGPAKRTAAHFDREVTPEDVIRWHKLFPEARA